MYSFKKTKDMINTPTMSKLEAWPKWHRRHFRGTCSSVAMARVSSKRLLFKAATVCVLVGPVRLQNFRKVSPWNPLSVASVSIHTPRKAWQLITNAAMNGKIFEQHQKPVLRLHWVARWVSKASWDIPKIVAGFHAWFSIRLHKLMQILLIHQPENFHEFPLPTILPVTSQASVVLINLVLD